LVEEVLEGTLGTGDREILVQVLGRPVRVEGVEGVLASDFTTPVVAKNLEPVMGVVAVLAY
jgi:hypothetical protein